MWESKGKVTDGLASHNRTRSTSKPTPRDKLKLPDVVRATKTPNSLNLLKDGVKKSLDKNVSQRNKTLSGLVKTVTIKQQSKTSTLRNKSPNSKTKSRPESVQEGIGIRSKSISSTPLTPFTPKTPKTPKLMSQAGSVDRYPAWEDVQTEAGRGSNIVGEPKDVIYGGGNLDALSEHQRTEMDSRVDTAFDSSRVVTGMAGYDEEEEDGWDTDLEDDRYPTRVSVTHDERARVVYMAACKKFRITPCSAFLKSLKTGHAKLNNQGLGPIGAKAIALSLVTNNTVKELRIAGNNIGRTGIRYLMDMVFENESIVHLDLSDNDLQSYGAELLCDVLEEDDSMLSLKLSGNRFKEGDAEYFLRILSYNKTALKELDLSHNEFGEEGGKILGKAIGNNDSLEILNLSWNQLRPEGCAPIAEGLRENTRITRLDLSWNGIEDKGANMIAAAAKDNDTLQYLNLVSNRIGPDGMSRLLTSFCANKVLKVLKISRNPITFEGPVLALEIINTYPDCNLELLEFKDMCVPKAFFYLLQTVNGSKPKFKVKHGGYVTGMESFQDAMQRRQENTINDPFMYLINYVIENKLKWTELFNRMDVDRNFSISHDEFTDGIRKHNIPLTETQIDNLMDRLDADGDGEVDLGELLAGHKKYLKRLKKVLGEKNLPRKFSVNLESLEPVTNNVNTLESGVNSGLQTSNENIDMQINSDLQINSANSDLQTNSANSDLQINNANSDLQINSANSDLQTNSANSDLQTMNVDVEIPTADTG